MGRPERVTDENEYEVQNLDDYEDPLEGSLGKRLARYVKDFTVKKGVLRFSTREDIPHGRFYIAPSSKVYEAWWFFIVMIALYSSMFTPIEFGFYRGLPRILWIVDLGVQFIFFADIGVRFFTAYRDPETFRLVVDHDSIAKRYIKSDFITDLLACLPWDTMYKRLGRKEEVRYLVWIRLFRVKKVDKFFERLEKDIRINYFATRIAKLLAVEFYCTHTAACIYYYLATTLPASHESYTWIGSLSLGSFSYHDFRAIDLGKRYVTSLYWAILTMATVGYGDIHAVNVREMIFIMIYVSFDMILGAYLIGNMTGLIVKGSNTERFRDKMTSLIKFMNRNGTPRPLRNELKDHVRLKFESGTMRDDDNILDDLPVSLRAKVAHARYNHIVKQVPVFKGCSAEFLDEIVSRVMEEHFLPGEHVQVQGGSSDQCYIVCHGALEEFFVHEDGREEGFGVLEEGSVFGEVGVICNIPQPFSVRVIELCRVLRLDKHAFSDIVRLYFNDGQLVINNLLECKDADARIGQVAADITFLVAKQAAEMTLMVNNASYQGDLVQLKQLVKEGAIVARPDYDGRTALHLAASKGYESVLLYLIREGADVNAIDKFGASPLLEAIKGGHDICMSVLRDRGAKVHLPDAGAFLCQTVMDGNQELLRRLLSAGVNVSAADYDGRTALHLAAAEGALSLARMLLDAGADSGSRDRWGRTPLDEAIHHKHVPLIALLKDADKSKLEKAKKDSEKRRKDLEQKGLTAPAGGSQPLSHRDNDSSGDLQDIPESTESFQDQFDFRRSSISSDSNPGTPRKVIQTKTDGKFGPEKFLDRRVTTLKSSSERQPGRRSLFASNSVSPQNSKRVTIFPYHPWTPAEDQTPGKVDWVPQTVEDLLAIAARHFGKVGSRLLNQDAGEVSSTDFIMDSEKIYVVNDEEMSTVRNPRS